MAKSLKNKMKFYKLQASGNDFILLDCRGNKSKTKRGYQKIARKFCGRRFGVGADGVLVIESSKKADFKMRIFNADGSEAEMCGNGARCAALWKVLNTRPFKKTLKFQSQAGVIEAKVKSPNKDQAKVAVKLTDPFDVKLAMPLKVNRRKINVNYINTGVPHTVVFVEGLDKIDVDVIGREVRYHQKFQPAGTNVDFVEFLDNKTIKVRTYERGVEAETFACGTGISASAVVSALKLPDFGKNRKYTEKVYTRRGEQLLVYFDVDKLKVKNLWLEGKAYFVYKGELIDN